MGDPVFYERKEAVTYGSPLLTVKDVSMIIGERVILREVNAQVRNLIREGHTQGQVVGFLGPSGRGKTTLFKIMAGLITPTKGEVLIGTEQKRVVAGRVGVVAQHYPLIRHMTVGQNLLLAAANKGLDKLEAVRKSRDLLKRFGLLDHWDDWPKSLSGGQRQRVAICQQIICSDKIILMDEPFSGLDLIAKDEVCKLIAEVAAMDEELTIVIITHDISSAIRASDHLWMLGFDRDAEGKPIEGSRIQREINLVERDLPWQPDVERLPNFASTMREVEEVFKLL